MTKRWPKLEELDLTVNTDKWYSDLSRRYPNYRLLNKKALDILEELKETNFKVDPAVEIYLNQIEKTLRGEQL